MQRGEASCKSQVSVLVHNRRDVGLPAADDQKAAFSPEEYESCVPFPHALCSIHKKAGRWDTLFIWLLCIPMTSHKQTE